MLLYRDNGRIYCENFSFILPHNIILGVDRVGNDVELHDPEGRWVIKLIQNFPLDEDEPLFKSHYDYYGDETPPHHPEPFSTPGGVSGESLLHDDDPRRYIWDVRIRPTDPMFMDVFWINLEAMKIDISWEEFKKIPAMQKILDSLRMESQESCLPL